MSLFPRPKLVFTTSSGSFRFSRALMERTSVRLLSAAAFLLLLLLVATESSGPRMVAEARKCESQSHKFKGPCARDSNCASVCHTEGFQGGDCRGLRRRCFCTREC